jgi:beta-barrel assembly-enhancing protease
MDDPVDAQYINDLGRRLVTAAGAKKQSFFFFFMADPVINSFAGPGGYIAIDSGLMLETENESELAAVMSHEIAHVTQGHLARELADQSHLNLSLLAGMLAAVALGHVSGDAAEGAIAGTMAGDAQSTLNHSRAYEEEADRVGMKTLAQAGFDPNSMVVFFQRLSRDEGYNLEPPPFLSNHPATPERIADAANRAAQYPVHPVKNSMDYALIKERLRVQTAVDVHALLNYYQKQPSALPLLQAEANAYGYALSKEANADYAGAYTDFTALVKAHPDALLFVLGQADSLADQNHFEEALTVLTPLHVAHPDNYAVMIQYAYTLMKAGQPALATATIQTYHLYHPGYPVPYALLADCQAKAGKLAEAYQSRAYYLAERGAVQAAMTQLQMALQLPHNDADSIARIKAQIQALQAEAHP